MKNLGAKNLSISVKIFFALFLIQTVSFCGYAQCVQVAEVQVDPADGENGSQYDTGEYIKICNTCSSTEDIGCWVLCLTDESGGIRGDCIRIPSGTSLAAGECFIFGSESGTNCGTPDCDWGGLTIDLDWHTCSGCVTDVDGDGSGYVGVLADGGENISLFDDNCNAQHLMSYCGGDLASDYTVTVNTSGGCASACTSYDINGSSGTWDDAPCCGGNTGDDEGYAMACDGSWSCSTHDTGDSYGDLDPTASWTCTTTPVEFVSFKGNEQGDKVYLNWVTADETDNDYFIVQRGLDDTKFENIAKINTRSTGNGLEEYVYVDETSDATVQYYRLKQVDENGNYNYSKVISVLNEINKLDIVSLKLNHQQIAVSYIEAIENTLEFEIYDYSGKSLKEEKMQSVKGLNNAILEVSDLPRGLYVLKIQNSIGQITVLKFTK